MKGLRSLWFLLLILGLAAVGLFHFRPEIFGLFAAGDFAGGAEAAAGAAAAFFKAVFGGH